MRMSLVHKIRVDLVGYDQNAVPTANLRHLLKLRARPYARYGIVRRAFPANTEGAFNQNIYTKSDWDKMEAAGAIFLPATGTRGLFSIQDAPQPIHGGVASQYWTSTRIDDYEA